MFGVPVTAELASIGAMVLGMMGNSYDGTDAGRLAMMADMPMVGFTDS